jgi:ADP-heptose:LPS heptosyltransferase
MGVMTNDTSAPLAAVAALASEPELEEASHGQAPARTILICRPNSRLGNTLLLTPLVQEIERWLPHARIDLITAFPGAAELFSGFRGVGIIHRLPFHGAGHPLRYAGALLSAAMTRHDVVIDPEPRSWTSGMLTRLMRAGRKVGFLSSRKHRGGYDSVPIEDAPAHMGTFPVYLFRRAVLGLGEDSARSPPPALDIRLSPRERDEGRRHLARLAGTGRPVLAIATAATGSKQLSVPWWRELARQFLSRTSAARIIEIRPPSGAASFPEYPGYASSSLRQVGAVIAATNTFVCADSGLMHLGSASLCPTVGLFRVTDPRVYGPYGPGNATVTVRDEAAPAIDQIIAQVNAVLARAPDRRRSF